MKKKVIKLVQMKVAEYVEKHNASSEKKINRHDVYKMIKEGQLKAHKGYKGAWIIDVEVEEPVKKCPIKRATRKTKKYTVKEFVEAYNKKFTSNPITIPEVRKLLANGSLKLKGEKVDRKWVISQSPSRRIK